MRDRWPQIGLNLSALISGWLGMQAVHEAGHVVGAWLTGGTVQRVVLHPLTISRTDLGENQYPLVVVWAGPLLGIMVPLAAWGVAVASRWSCAFLLRFFSGFCLVANGLYISVGSLGRVGDCGVMLQHGSPIEALWLFGLVTVPCGFWLWHGLGLKFGWGVATGDVDSFAVQVSLSAALGLLVLGILVGGR